MGPDPGNSQPSNSPHPWKRPTICSRVVSHAKSKSGAPSCLLRLPECHLPRKAPARSRAGRPAQPAGRYRQRCIVSRGDLEDFPRETDIFLTVFFEVECVSAFSYQQYKEIFFFFFPRIKVTMILKQSVCKGGRFGRAQTGKAD